MFTRGMAVMKIEKHHVKSFFIAIGIFLLVVLIYTQSTLFDIFENGSIDFRFFLRDPSEKVESIKKGVSRSKPNMRANQDILIIALDEESIRSFNALGVQWPFPWDIHAKVTKHLGTGQPNSILFDIMFLDNKPKEKILAKAIKSAKNVFLDYPFETKQIDVKYKDQKQRISLLNKVRWAVPASDKNPLRVEEAVPPTSTLTKAAKGIGFANIFTSLIDNINRKMPLIIKFYEKYKDKDGKEQKRYWYYPNIDLIVLMNYFGITQKDVEIKIGEYIKLKNIPLAKMKKKNDKREIVIPIDNYGSMLINFIGSTGSFTSLPYRYFYRDDDLMKEGNDSLKGKLLLIAVYASTGIAKDEKHSPYGPTFGIEHHANALNTIINQDFLYRMSDTQNIMIMLIIALLFGIILSRISITASTISSLVLILFYFVMSYILFDSYSIIIGLTTPLSQIFITYAAIITFRVKTEQKEKKYIRSTFSKFISKSVVDELLKHPDKLKLGGEKKILTVLFSDIRGFTSISERLTPEELVEHLNVYLQAMTDLVFKYNGTLDKYVGDEIMAFWGAPIELENHALESCKCAIEMMEVLTNMNKNWRMQDKPELNIGIGLNTGDMVVGNMGSASRMDYTLMGDNVNLGARLEGTNKVYGTNIIISEMTYQYVKEKVIVRELDLIRVKGKELPVRIYELVGMKA